MIPSSRGRAKTATETSGIHFAPLRHRNALDVARTLNAIYRGGTIDEKNIPAGITVPSRSAGLHPGSRGIALRLWEGAEDAHERVETS